MSKGTKKTHIWGIASGWAECRPCDVSAADCGGLACHAERWCNQQAVWGLVRSTEATKLKVGEWQDQNRHLDVLISQPLVWIKSPWPWGQWKRLCGRKYGCLPSVRLCRWLLGMVAPLTGKKGLKWYMLKSVTRVWHSHLDLWEWLPFGGGHGLVSHPSSVNWKVKLMAFIVIMLFRDTGGWRIPGCQIYQLIIRLVFATQILRVALLFSGNLLVSESLENVIKIRSLLDEYRIRTKRVRCP